SFFLVYDNHLLVQSCTAAHHPREQLSASFLFTVPAPPQIYTLSLHDALPISAQRHFRLHRAPGARHSRTRHSGTDAGSGQDQERSEEHTSELQSLAYLVCRLLLEKKNSSVRWHGTSAGELGAAQLNPRRQGRR